MSEVRRVKKNCGGVVVKNTVTLDGKRVVELFYGDVDGASLTASGARQIANALTRAAAYIDHANGRLT